MADTDYGAGTYYGEETEGQFLIPVSREEKLRRRWSKTKKPPKITMIETVSQASAIAGINIEAAHG